LSVEDGLVSDTGVKGDIKIELTRELAFESPASPADIGIRAGGDALHPVYRSRVVTSFASWDLLALHDHREVKTVAVHAVEQHGAGPATGRYVGGMTPALTACEVRVARFFAADTALLFSSKNQALLSTITSLCSEGVVVLGPALTSLPLADACVLVGAEFAEFEGEDELRQMLERHRAAKRVIVVAEAVSSVTGKKLATKRFFSALEQTGAWGIVDETSALGFSGLRGAGSAEDVPGSPALLARVVQCSSVVGVELAAVVGSSELRELLLARSRYVRFELAPSSVAAAAVHRALDLVEVAISQRERLGVRSKMVQAAVRAQGWVVLSEDDSPILSIWVESLGKARELQEGLLQRGIVVEALPARSTRRNGAVVRILLSTGHSEEEISRLMDGLLEIRKRRSDAE
jgi:7-keto-8-aminopelargonate synthetase-like enzyme